MAPGDRAPAAIPPGRPRPLLDAKDDGALDMKVEAAVRLAFSGDGLTLPVGPSPTGSGNTGSSLSLVLVSENLRGDMFRFATLLVTYCCSVLKKLMADDGRWEAPLLSNREPSKGRHQPGTILEEEEEVVEQNSRGKRNTKGTNARRRTRKRTESTGRAFSHLIGVAAQRERRREEEEEEEETRESGNDTTRDAGRRAVRAGRFRRTHVPHTVAADAASSSIRESAFRRASKSERAFLIFSLPRT